MIVRFWRPHAQRPERAKSGSLLGGAIADAGAAPLPGSGPGSRSPHRARTRSADGIYALLALRSFATSWAPLTDEVEDLGQTNLSCGSYDDMLPNTPLCSAIYVIERESVGLLLEHRADPNGYHSRHFDWETQPHEDISPLFTTAMQRRPHLVKMRLQAHADPNECGYEKDLSGEAVSPEGGEHAPPGSRRCGKQSRTHVTAAQARRKAAIDIRSCCCFSSTTRTATHTKMRGGKSGNDEMGVTR